MAWSDVDRSAYQIDGKPTSYTGSMELKPCPNCKKVDLVFKITRRRRQYDVSFRCNCGQYTCSTRTTNMVDAIETLTRSWNSVRLTITKVTNYIKENQHD